MLMRLGTRGSNLAMIQAGMVKQALAGHGVDAEIVTNSTHGDRDRSSPIYAMKRVGVFVEELNDMILSGECDAAVHSAKDIPSRIPDELEVSAVLPRASFNDVLVSRSTLEDLGPGSVVGTSSLRRISELKSVRDDLKILDIRGNIDTRLRKLEEGSYDGIILAKAALERMKLNVTYQVLPEEVFVPAPNQGIIAIVSRKNSEERKILQQINDSVTQSCFEMERELVGALELGCSLPAGILCVPSNGKYRITSRFHSLHSSDFRDYCEVVEANEQVAEMAMRIRRTLPRSFGYGFGV